MFKWKWSNGERIKAGLVCAVLMFVSCTSPKHAEVEHLNEVAYSFHYRDLDSTRIYAEKAFESSKGYADGRAEALNHLAFVGIAKMEYQDVQQKLDEVLNITDNQIERLIAYVQYMRLCQRQSKNKEFYHYRQQAETCLKRINEDSEYLSTHEKSRLIYAKSEYSIVLSTYFYYVGLTTPSMEALDKIDAEGEIKTDTAQTLNYLYNIGAGGIILEGTHEKIIQQEFDYLLRCYLISVQYGYTYWTANTMQALAEHMEEAKDREFLIRQNFPAMKFVNIDHMADSLLAGNLAQRALESFSKYGDVYQTAGAYRTLAECYWGIQDYSSALICLNKALETNEKIEQAPDLVASIREQLSLAYSAIDDKYHSDYNRNIYLDMQEITRQDRQLEARADQLYKSSQQLNLMMTAVIIAILLLIVLLFIFDYMRRKSNAKFSIQQMMTPLAAWKKTEEERIEDYNMRAEDITEQLRIVERRLEENKKRNLEQRAKVSLVNGITPFIGRMLHEVDCLISNTECTETRKERLEYIAELADEIWQYNSILSRWIQMRQGELHLHIESFALQPLFDIVSKNRMTFSMKGVNLEVIPTSDIVKADRALTLFMINTITDNARKFTENGGTVRLCSTAADDYVEISVEDTGRGMTEEDARHVFDNNIIHDGAENGSHGFGLVNCKGIIEKYKKVSKIFNVCDIMVQSQLGHGSVFSFRLPIGRLKILLPLLFLSVNIHADGMTGTLNHNLAEASAYADSAYFSNINGTYSNTLTFADSCISYLNRFYLQKFPKGRALMQQMPSVGEPAELEWFHENLPTDFAIILDIRNEIAVASLALHQWDRYHYNNKVYTQLFREKSADNTLDSYVKVMQRSEINKNVSIALLALLLLLIFPAYYFLYYRHRLNYRFCIDRIDAINEILLDEMPAQDKIIRIQNLWSERDVALLNDTRIDTLSHLVGDIERALEQSIESQMQLQTGLELAEDELHKAMYEDDQLHISNSVLDNCLSALKHETMYYPSRIRQLVDTDNQDLSAIKELLSYYKNIYTILSTQTMRLVGENTRIDYFLLEYLVELLCKAAGSTPNPVRVDETTPLYVAVEYSFPDLRLTEEEREALFTPKTIQLQYLLCRQIMRDLGEASHARGCGIQALSGEGEGTIIRITLSKAIWRNSKLSLLKTFPLS